MQFFVKQSAKLWQERETGAYDSLVDGSPRLFVS